MELSNYHPIVLKILDIIDFSSKLENSSNTNILEISQNFHSLSHPNPKTNGWEKISIFGK